MNEELISINPLVVKTSQRDYKRTFFNSFCQNVLPIMKIKMEVSVRSSTVEVVMMMLLLITQNGHSTPKIMLTKSTSSGAFRPSSVEATTFLNGDTNTRIGQVTSEIPKEFKTCNSTPIISIISYNRDEFLPNATMKTELIAIATNVSTEEGIGHIWMAPFAATVELECRAASPIQWIFDGPLEPEVLSIGVRRERVENDNENAQNCFRVVLKMVTRKRSTGKYRCHQIDSLRNQNQSTWVYLYGEVNGPPFLLYQGREFTVFQKESTRIVTLPCQVVNPTLTPELFKGNSQVVSLQASVPYNPQLGFTLDLEKIPNPFDNYKCSREGGSVYVSIKPIKDFRVTPSSIQLTVVEGKSLQLICEGKFPIGLQGYIDDSKVTIIRDDNANVYKYKVTYEYYLTGKEPSTGISCVNLRTTEVLHTWHSSSISSEVDKQSGIRYDAETQRFYCHSKSEDPPTIALAQCDGFMECQLTDKCFTWNVPYKITNGGNNCFSENEIQRGIACRRDDKKRFNSTVGCAYVPNSLYYAGTVHCVLPDNGEYVKMYFFNGLKSGADMVISDWHDADTAELIDIAILEQNRTFYTHELIEFECTVPKFIFAQGQIFKFKLDDGTFVTPNETVRHGAQNGDFDDDSLIIKTSRLELHDNRIREVICISPFWNETGWMNNSIPISVIASIPPKIIQSDESAELIHVNVGVNTSITCEAEGLPLPKLNWFRGGKRVEGQEERVSHTGKSKTQTLYFGHVGQDDGGEYACEATNVAGKEVMNVRLLVTQSRRTVYTALIIGIITITILLAIVTVLWKKLRKNQAIVRRLTEKEVQEFREGDSNALRSIPDGYIRAQYLPYNKDYEIKQENLEIDEEILGKGEYGIVLKGTLRLNDYVKEVAVKTSRSPDVNHFKALLTELKMLTYIGWHDHVINLLGAVTRNLRDRDVYVVVEYCRLGDLESFLCHNRSAFLNQILNEKIDLNISVTFNAMQSYQPFEYTMRTADLISWSYQIASGMEYLGNKKVIHGDLAARNILLSEDRTVRITDFGLSKHLYNGSNYISHSSLNLPWKHCAPEVLEYNSFSTHSDVWAFGVTLWEIFTLGDPPYPGVAWNWDFKTYLLQGNRMEKPAFANQHIYNHILKCWKNTPAERISFEELRKFFHRLLHHWAEEQENNLGDSPSQVKLQNLLGNHYVVSPTNPQRSAQHTTVTTC